jgi:phosphate/sulfate permease
LLNNNKPAAPCSASKYATNADLAEIKAELAALKTKSDGWWNWRLGEDGWMSWINTPAIAITTAVFIVYSLRNIHSLYNKFVDHINNYYNPSMDAVEEMQKKVNEHTKDIANLKKSAKPEQEL